MGYLNNSTLSQKQIEISCSSCGMTLREFKKTGIFGCEECYKTLDTIATSVINKVQGKSKHTGKIPKKFGKDMINKKYLIRLKDELQKVIAEENFERAVELRDLIREITDYGGEK